MIHPRLTGGRFSALGRAFPSIAIDLSEVASTCEATSGHVSISTMYLAKALEYRAVVVMACDDEVVPLQERVGSVDDENDLLEVYETECHLLYVACTRAHDYLLFSGVTPVSEFPDDLHPL